MWPPTTTIIKGIFFPLRFNPASKGWKGTKFNYLYCTVALSANNYKTFFFIHFGKLIFLNFFYIGKTKRKKFERQASHSMPPIYIFYLLTSCISSLKSYFFIFYLACEIILYIYWYCCLYYIIVLLHFCPIINTNTSCIYIKVLHTGNIINTTHFIWNVILNFTYIISPLVLLRT